MTHPPGTVEAAALSRLDAAGGPAVPWIAPHSGCGPGSTVNVEALSEQLARTYHSQALTLAAADLGDKWGFGDGDVLAQAVQVWREHVSWPEGDEFGGWPYISDRHLLWQLTQEHLLPAVGLNKDEVYWVGGVHNPVRSDVDRRGIVKVEWREVAQAMTAMFEPRSLGWLSLHAAVCSWVCGYTVPGNRRGEVVAHTEAVYAKLGETTSLVTARLRLANLNVTWTEIAQVAQAASAPPRHPE